MTKGACREEMKVEIRRSARRRKTISAKIVDNTMILQVPSTITGAQEKEWIERMQKRLLAALEEKKRETHEELHLLAADMNATYLEGKAAYSSIECSKRQKKIFGSCSVRSGRIRISSQVLRFPPWVIAYVVLHELAHLIYPDHSKKFWAIVQRYPLAEKARGFLLGYAYGRGGKRK
jgi:predicted metal-dependent hydrolase